MMDATPRFTVLDLLASRDTGCRLVMVTAYDHPTARIVDEAGVDLVLVGDSAAMVVLGHDATTAIGIDEMVLLGGAVRRGTSRALVVVDMPFGSYEASDELAVASACRLVAEGGADAVKLEGGGRMVERVRAISEAGIAVVGHLGLTPQSAARLGGFRAQARTSEAARRLVADALALEQAGAVCIVLEAVPADVAREATRQLRVPTIGIGAGDSTTGQVLVLHDLAGISTGPLPRFVERFGNVGDDLRAAVARYATAVRDGSFPRIEHEYAMPEHEQAAFLDRDVAAATN